MSAPTPSIAPTDNSFETTLRLNPSPVLGLAGRLGFAATLDARRVGAPPRLLLGRDRSRATDPGRTRAGAGLLVLVTDPLSRNSRRESGRSVNSG
ncbi:MAG: hypothetical protein ACYCZY_00410 [Lacisediminihabitans sp.]